MAEASADNKAVARLALAALGGEPRVFQHRSDDSDHALDILYAAGRPRRGHTAYSTVNLSDAPLQEGGRELDFRVEIVAACKGRRPKFANAVGTAGLFVVRNGWLPRPGAVFENMLGMYRLATDLTHFYFTAPSHWPELNTTVQLATKRVTWVWAVPITEAESRFVADHGGERLEERLEAEGADVFDLTRPPVV